MKKINDVLSLSAFLVIFLTARCTAQSEVINVDITLIHETDVMQDSNGWAAYAILESFGQALEAVGCQPHLRVYSIKTVKKDMLTLDPAPKKNFFPAQWSIQILTRSEKNKIEYTIDAVSFTQKKHLVRKSVYSTDLTDQLFSTHEKAVIEFLKSVNLSNKETHQKATSKIQITQNAKAYQYFLMGKVLLTATQTEERLNRASEWYQKAIREDAAFLQAHTALASIHILKKEYERAFTIYEAYLNQNSKAKNVYGAIGDIYYDHLNNTKKAKDYFEKELAVNTQSSSILIRLGYCANDDKNYELAKQYATQALKLNALDSPALNLLGLSAMGMKDTANAKEHFSRSVKINSCEIPARKNLARMFEIRDRFDEAKELYRQIIAIEPLDAFAILSLANLDYLQNEWKEAAALYMQAVLIKPELESPKENPIQIFQFISKNKKDVKPVQALMDSLNEVLLEGDADAQDEFLYRTAIGYMSLYYTGDFTEAANQFQIALKLRPGTARLRYYLAESYFRLDKFQQALDFYQIYADDARDSYSFARCHLMIGKILFRQKKFEDAQLEILKSIRMYPNAESYYYYGLALKGNKQNEEAVGAFEKAVKIYPNYVEAHLELSRAFGLMKKYDKSILHAQKAVLLDSGDYYGRQALSNVYFTLERWEDAEKEIVEGIRLMKKTERSDPELYGDYGDILIQLNNADKALLQYEIQWQMDSTSTVAPYRIASIYAFKNDEAGALEWMLKAFHNKFTEFSDLGKNKMFDRIRNNPAFKELVSQYEQAYREEILKRIQQKK